MPSEAEHLTKAVNNRGFADACNGKYPTSAGWALTALFYSALHYVEAYNVAKLGKSSRNHRDVKIKIQTDPNLQPISDDYEDLLNFSWNARYRVKNYGEQQIKEAQEYQENVAGHISSLLGH